MAEKQIPGSGEMLSGSTVKHSCKLVINTGNYSAIHIDHELEIAIPNGNVFDPKYMKKVEEAQQLVSDQVMKHQMVIKGKIEDLLEQEARKK